MTDEDDSTMEGGRATVPLPPAPNELDFLLPETLGLAWSFDAVHSRPGENNSEYWAGYVDGVHTAVFFIMTRLGYVPQDLRDPPTSQHVKDQLKAFALLVTRRNPDRSQLKDLLNTGQVPPEAKV
jgi:hypothetical protein